MLLAGDDPVRFKIKHQRTLKLVRRQKMRAGDTWMASAAGQQHLER